MSEPCGGRWNCTLPRGHNTGQVDIPENHSPVPTREQVAADEQTAWDEWNRWGPTVTATPMIREAHRAGYLAAKGID